jgi:ribonuclease P protein subunit RPR2
MAKAGKSNKAGTGTGMPQKHLHSRIAYLYEAAAYLSAAEDSPQEQENRTRGLFRSGPYGDRAGRSNHQHTLSKANDSTTAESGKTMECNINATTTHASAVQSRHLLASMRSISQKSQLRLSQSIKRSVCRRCNALLALNSSAEIENPSREGRKPWADVLVIRCCQCGFVKRYPVGIERAPKRKTKESLEDAAAAPGADLGNGKVL